MEKDIEYHQAKLKIAQELCNKEKEVEMLSSISHLLNEAGKSTDAISYSVKALKMIQDLGDRKQEQKIYENLGNQYYSIGEYDTARECYMESLKIARELSDKNEESIVLQRIGFCLANEGKSKDAIDYDRKSLKLAQELGDKEQEQMMYRILGIHYQDIEDYDTARECSMESLKIARELGYKEIECIVLQDIGVCLGKEGKRKDAIYYDRKSLKLAQELGDRKQEGILYRNLGLHYQKIEEYDTARECYMKSLTIAREFGEKNVESTVLQDIGVCLGKEGKSKDAIDYDKKSLKLAQELGDRKQEQIMYRNLGLHYHNIEEYDSARESSIESLKIARELGDKNEESIMLQLIGVCLGKEGKSKDAIDYDKKSLKLAQELGNRNEEQRMYINLGAHYRLIEEYDTAKECLMESLKIAQELGDKFAEWLVYKHLKLLCEETGRVELSLYEYYRKALKSVTELSANETPEVTPDKRNINEGVHSQLSSKSSTGEDLKLDAEDKQSLATAAAVATSTEFDRHSQRHGPSSTSDEQSAGMPSSAPGKKQSFMGRMKGFFSRNTKKASKDGRPSKDRAADGSTISTSPLPLSNATGVDSSLKTEDPGTLSTSILSSGNATNVNPNSVNQDPGTPSTSVVSPNNAVDVKSNYVNRERSKAVTLNFSTVYEKELDLVELLEEKTDKRGRKQSFMGRVISCFPRNTKKASKDGRPSKDRTADGSTISTSPLPLSNATRVNSSLKTEDPGTLSNSILSSGNATDVNSNSANQDPGTPATSVVSPNNAVDVESNYVNRDPGTPSTSVVSFNSAAEVQSNVVNEDDHTSSTPSVHSRNKASAPREIRWRQVSRKHRPKFERLVELRKTTPSTISKKGTYSMCFREEFCIGEGSDGTKVYVGLCDDGKEVAVKRLSVRMCKDLAMNEINILVSPSVRKEHHVVNYLFYDIDEVDGYVYVILDLCEEDLHEYVSHRNVEELKKEGPKIFREILKGLEALHSGDPKILHRDLRPGNVLVNCENEMVLSDFGISRSIKKETKTHVSRPTDVQGWVAVESIPTDDDEEDDDLAPEQIQVRYKVESDIQVTGMLFFYIVMGGKHPYGKSLYKQMHNISEGNPVYLDKLDDPVAKDLIQWMLQHTAESRPIAQECLKHPYLLSKDEQFDLVKSVGNQAEIKTNDPTSPVVQKLNADTSLPKPSWKSAIDVDVMKHICAHRSYSNDIADLLRMIRNTAEHWYDKKHPAAIELKVGEPKEYFLKLFPTLPVVLHRIIRNDPHWKQREQLKKFF